MASEKKPASKIKELRNRQIQHLDVAIESLSAKKRALNDKAERVRVLESVAFGLYDELDKLAKKAPADQVTNLVLEQTNDVIREAKELLSDDPYVQRYKEFVAAGDNPEHRDVVVVLRQIRQGLSRFTEGVQSRKGWLDAVMQDAKGVRSAAILSRDGETDLERDDLSEYEGKIMSRWFNEEGLFDFDRLDQTSIESYYNI